MAWPFKDENCLDSVPWATTPWDGETSVPCPGVPRSGGCAGVQRNGDRGRRVRGAGTTTTQFDKLTITVNGTTLATFSNLNRISGYAQHTYPLGSFAGSAVTTAINTN